MQKAVVSDQWSVISNQAVHGSRITHHVSRITRPSSVAPRPSERGVALVITLVLLSVITFMAVTFLVVSRSQHGAVSIETDQQIARMAADTARERAIAELLAPIMTWNNEFNYGLLVSTNYISTVGYDQTLPLGTVYPINVNYDYTIAGAPLTLNQQLQNLANLLYNPRPPVFIVTNAAAARSNEFRFFVDLNRNGAFDPSGFMPLTNGLGLRTGNMGSLIGDPQWIGGLQRPEFAHSATNLFTHRYAYLVVPAGQTLDLNTIHNYAKSSLIPGNIKTPWPDGFLRNQGILTAELNLAALLVDLNTNLWPPSTPSEFSFSAYTYNTGGNAASTGAAADDAASLVRYRYATNLYALANVQSLFGLTGANAFNAAPIDGYSEGPIMTGTWWTPPANFNGQVKLPWAGSDNPNRFYTTQDIFDRSKLGLSAAISRGTPFSFIDRLLMAGTNIDSYNRYTFYRLLSQVGTDSAPEPPGKMNLNYCNVDNNGNVVPNMATNFIPWNPAQFFTNAAIRLLANAGYAVGPANSATNLLLLSSNYVNGTYVYITNLHIPLWPTNYYTPSVQRLLQLAANMYDATTVRPFGQATATTNGFPSVFRPLFSIGSPRNPNVSIIGFAEVTNASVLLPGQRWTDLNISPLSLKSDDMVYGVPLVIGAKKGYPNFNEFAMQTYVQISRKLEFRRALGDQSGAIIQTNQMYVLTISNVFGIEAWNSYSTPYPRDLVISVIGAAGSPGDMGAGLTDVQGVRTNMVWNFYTNFNTSQLIPAFTWPGYIDTSSSGSVKYPLWTNLLTLTNSQYMQNSSPPLVPVSVTGNTFERPSSFKSPDFWLTFTNRVRYALVDKGAGRIVDFVNLEVCGGSVHISDLMGAGGCGNSTKYNFVDGADWCTNREPGADPKVTADFGVRNQIFKNLALTRNRWSDIYQNDADFFRAQFGFGPQYNHPAGTTFTKTNTFYASYIPTFATNFATVWQANDPLVHYTIPDLIDAASTAGAMASFHSAVFLNPRYRPWGGNPLKPAIETAASLAYKDPVAFVAGHLDNVAHSDDWDFPTNKLPNAGWLGRVHRGTPWQTVYLKPYNFDLPTWQNWKNWTGNGVIVTNLGQFSTNMVLPISAVYYPVPVPTPPTITFSNGVAVYDAYFTLPTSDWHFLDLFTTALSDSATRGQLSINQTNLAAWSAALSGVWVLTNNVVAGTLNGLPIEPAGVYDPFNTNTWTPIVQIVNNINNVRTNFPNGEFHTLGDLLATPALTIASPFLNTSIPLSDPHCLLNDEVYERLPQQILGLLKCDHTPRFVIYAFGQTLKPESTRAIVKSGQFAGMCTNYQIVAEAATRTVVRFEGVPLFQPGSPPPPITSLHPVIESFTVLPPD